MRVFREDNAFGSKSLQTGQILHREQHLVGKWNQKTYMHAYERGIDLQTYLFNIVSCNASMINSNTKLTFMAFTYSLNIYCQGDNTHQNSIPPSSLHDSLFEESKSLLVLEIRNCFITSLSEHVFGKPLSHLTIQGKFHSHHGHQNSLCKQELEANITPKETVCANDHLLFPTGILSDVKLKDLEMSGLRVNDSIWLELGEMPIKTLNFANNKIESIDGVVASLILDI